MRGSIAQNDIAGNKTGLVKGNKKGRNNDLIQARNICLVHRYYYYTKILHLRYDLLLFELQNEFFLSAETIPRIIEKHLEQIKKMDSDKITPKQLAKMFPFFSWVQKARKEIIRLPEREVYNRY